MLLMNEFFVGAFKVDMGRSEIVAQDAIVSMEPKVLQVLLILAKHQGEVVTHQQILDSVWQDVKVDPNTLQRCIAQLRKALGDNAKSQGIIKTHPKMGYRLLANVSWQGKISTLQSESRSTSDISAKQKKSKAIIAATVVMLVIALINIDTGQWSPFSSSSSRPPLNKLTAVTTTDKKEFSASYSPDGRYIAFQRYVGLCENEIWAKDLKQNREYLLTKNSGIYGTPSWSPNGENLAFSNVTHCSMTREFQGCKDIRVVSFALAKSEPQDTNVLIPCEQQDYSAAVWITDDTLAFFAKQGRNNEVKKLTISTNAIETIYQGEQVLFDSISYSAKQNKLAVTQHDLNRQASLVLIDHPSGKTKQVELTPPGSYRGMVSWNTNWHPTDAKLITAKGNTIFEIDLDGQFTEYPIPTMQSISDPFFHPDGDRVIASMGIFDKDSHILNWQVDATGIGHYQLSNIHRSIVSERNPRFDLNGNRVAYISETSGSQQIWLTELSIDGLTTLGDASQLTDLHDNAQITSMAWSYDGKLLIATVDGQLNLLNLDGQLTPIETSYRVVDIYQSPSKNKVLIEVSEAQVEKIVLFDFQNKHSKELYRGDVRWGQISETGILYFSDIHDSLYQVIDSQLIKLSNMDDIRVSAIFHYDRQQLMLTGRDNSIWQYDLSSQTKKKLFRINQVLKRVDQTDLATNRLLITTVASTTKEIVEFHN